MNNAKVVEFSRKKLLSVLDDITIGHYDGLEEQEDKDIDWLDKDESFKCFALIEEELEYVERIALIKPGEYNGCLEWYILHGTAWIASFEKEDLKQEYGVYEGKYLPDRLAHVFYGKWTSHRYLHEFKGTGYSCDNFFQEMTKDMFCLQNAINLFNTV